MNYICSQGPRIEDIDGFTIWDSNQVLDQSPACLDVKNAKYIFCAEIHNELGSRLDVATFIKETVVPGSVLLVENCKALMEVKGKKREQILNDLFIDEVARPMITVIGWDRHNDYFPDSKRKGAFFDEQPLIRLSERLVLLSKLQDDLNVFPPELKKVAEGVVQEAYDKYIEEIADIFPERTKCMAHTLRTLENEGQIKGKIYLIAGRLHLVENPAQTDPRYQLKIFQEVFQQLPAIIISSNRI